jgi:hypothetical protein
MIGETQQYHGEEMRKTHGIVVKNALFIHSLHKIERLLISSSLHLNSSKDFIEKMGYLSV